MRRYNPIIYLQWRNRNSNNNNIVFYLPIQEWKDEIFCPYQLLNELLSETILADILKDFVAALLTYFY